jgi:hypothetical protein
MLKLLVLIVALGVGGYFLYGYLYPEKRACAHLLTELCRNGEVAVDRQRCEELFQKVKESAGREAASSSAQCIAESGSCGQAVGCVAGAVGKVGVGFLGEFIKGAEKTFSGKK